MSDPLRKAFADARDSHNLDTLRALLQADNVDSELRKDIQVAIAAEENRRRPFLGSSASRM